MNLKKYITKVDVITIIFYFMFMLVFLPKACPPANASDYEIPWQTELSHQIYTAHNMYLADIDRDPTDMGCTLAEISLQHRIDSILSNFESHIINNIESERIDDYMERLLDEHGAVADMNNERE